jgi:flagellar assembly protein FliH
MAKPFLFDNHDFDAAAEALAIPPEERPQFSQVDMEGAVSSAQNRGFEEGLAAAIQSEEAKLVRLTEKLLAEMQAMQDAEEERNSAAQKMAIDVAMGLMRKLMPELATQSSIEGVSEIVAKVMMDRFEEPRLIIRVHDDIMDAVNARLQSLAQQAGFRGQYALMADTNLSLPDCRIEWSNGGVERSVTRLWDNLQISLSQFQATLSPALGSEKLPVKALESESVMEIFDTSIEIITDETPNESEES